MKKSILLIYTVLCALTVSSTAQATMLNASADKKAIVEARLKALFTGKKVMVVADAAWCPTCFYVDQWIHDVYPALKPALDRYVVVHIEEMYQEIPYLTDYSVVDPFDYPNYFLLDPLSGKWSTVSYYGDEAFTVKVLNDFADGKDVARTSVAAYNDAVATGVHLGYDDGGHIEILDQVLRAVSTEGNAAELAHFTMKLRQDVVDHPEQFHIDDLDPSYGLTEMINRAYDMNYSKGRASIADYQAIDPRAFNDYPDTSTYYKYVQQFELEVRKILLNHGLKAAALACNKIAAIANLSYSDVDYVDGGSVVEGRMLTCTQLQYEAGQKTKTEVLAAIETLTSSQKTDQAKKLASLYAAIGEFDLATASEEQVRAFYLSWFPGDPDMTPRINAAADLREQAFAAHKTHPFYLKK